MIVEPTQSYVLDGHQIPTGELTHVPDPPWDDCFVGLASDPRIIWPEALSLTISSTLDHWVIYTETDHALCVEPQSGPPNELNRDPHTIPAGGVMRASMTLTWP